MTTQRVELFALNATTPDHTALHGAAMLRASAEAGASFRRGIDLSAGFELEAVVSAEAGRQARASLQAGGSVRAGLALRAGLPLDLFADAGFIAEFRAQVEAAAFVRARVSLAVDEFCALLSDALPAGPVRELLPIVLGEFNVEAGIWARASFSAQILGEVALVGTLRPTGIDGAGFSARARYAVGWLAGAGIDLIANIGIEDPRRLLDRLAQAMAAIVVREARAAADRTGEPMGAVLRGAAPVLEFVLPLSLQAAFRLGLELASAPTAAARAQAARSVATTLIELAQQQLLSALVKLGLERLASAFALQDVLAASGALEAPARERALEALRALFDSLVALEHLEADLATWVPAVNRCVGNLEPVLDALAPALPADFTASARRAVATVWAAGVLLERILHWRTGAAAAVGDLFGATPVAAGTSGSAATVGAALGRPAGAALTLVDLVDFIVGGDVEQSLRALVPGAAEVMDFLGDVLATPAGGVIRQVLAAPPQPQADAAQALLARLATVLGAVVRELAGRVITPIKAANPGNVALAAFLDEMVEPTLAAIPAVVLPRIPSLDQPEECLRLREALSALILQSLGRFVLACTDVLIARGLRDGASGLRALSDEVVGGGPSSAALGQAALAGSGAALPLVMTPAELSSIVRLAADIMDRWNARGRPAVLAAVGSVLEMGLSNDDARAARLALILDSDAPPAPQVLQAALDRTCDSLWDIVDFASPRLLDILGAYFRRQLQVLATALHEGARVVVAAVVAAVKWLGEQIAQLRQRLAQLARDIAYQATQLVQGVRALSVQLRTRVSQAVDAARNAGLRLLEPLLAGLPGWVADELRNLFRALFEAVAWMVTLPLQILETVSGWIEEVLSEHLESTGNDEQRVHATVRRKIQQAVGGDLHFELALSVAGLKLVDLGRITLPAGEIAGAIADFVIGDAGYRQTVRTAAARSVDLQALRAQEATTRRAYEQSLSQPAASAAAAEAVPGKPLVADIAGPAPLSVVAGPAVLVLRLDGANETFVRPVLGIPARVVLRVNGREVAVPASAWRRTPQGLALTLKLRAPGPTPLPPPAAPPRPPGAPLVLDRVLGTVTAADRAGHIRVEPVGDAAAASRVLGAPALAARGDIIAVARAPLTLGSPGGNLPLRAPTLLAGGPGAALQPGLEVVANGKAMTGGEVRPVTAVRASVLLQKLAVARDYTDLPPVTSTPSPSATTPATDAEGALVLEGLAGLNSIELTATDGANQQAVSSRLFFLGAGTPAAAAVDRMKTGDVLLANRSLRSGNGKYQFIFQGDGNLVLYRRGGLALWASATAARGGRAIYEADGNLVVYAADNRPAWFSKGGTPGSGLVVQDDGNVVIYRPDGGAAWSTGTWERPVTYGSVVKLRHRATGVTLHSHALVYGHPGSSRQQQVTGFAGADDNDLWRIMGPHGQPDTYRAGQRVANGAVVRLRHVLTGRHLHSHAGFPSPVTRQQEVTCFGEMKGLGDGNDNWRLEMTDATQWGSSDPLRLIHVPTNVALHSHAGFSHAQWTAGQQEVTGFAGRDDNDLWFVFEVR